MEDICGTTTKFIGNWRSVDETVVSNTVENWVSWLFCHVPQPNVPQIGWDLVSKMVVVHGTSQKWCQIE